MKRIICFHLLNDYSGSPKVLRMVLDGLLKRGHRVNLVSSSGGVLDELGGYDQFKKHSYRYAFSENPAVTMLRYLAIQIYTFFFAFRYLFCKDCVFYINTLLPMGPALAGRLMGKHVVYHYHENAFVKGAFYKILAWAMQRLAHKIICVSKYQASFLTREKGVIVVPNALPQKFVEKLSPNQSEAYNRKTVLMLGSLKLYKGTLEFIELARRLPEYNFELVINDAQDNINKFFSDYKIENLSNLSVHSRQSDVTPFYNRASLVLNLTDKRQAIETFGLTVLEAMSAGLPTIVPTEGGIAEMVQDGVNGYKIDAEHLNDIEQKICYLLSNEGAYIKMAESAHDYAMKYSEASMITKLISIIDENR